MLISEQMVPEFTRETAVTRKLLARVPDDKVDWSPGIGLRSIGWNASHLAEIAGWIPFVLQQPKLDIAPFGGEAVPQPDKKDVTELLKHFDQNVATSLAALKGVTDTVMAETWTMKAGGHVLFSMTKGDCLRKWVLSHTAHHRGILSAYLRMGGVPHDSIDESDWTE
ncbi:DinB superfamily protein [Gemmata obscuriglobus]|uniref:Damage-inducible protein DinB n=1 Tax=Gemmata obscuriglobus TaxID=114 RepID=A0A2Z3GZ45_9BACT|nr:DinB family protein [Gemmata obscuriglobus]AWM37332.1 damage-inducible protein DinB [Gemmata obscuriglobus]QEG29912.1 DinB superfamily protein [Gemmata obscuriglobus]VTS09231.1 Uncharacterized protein OS=Blastopirellula marina DSM 3645 GN=DSM3645_09907 PE=4 SV=1: DinB [Gemmata obscuriglobus UQM 2246]